MSLVNSTFSTHINNPEEELNRLNITGAMVRLSVGLESAADLCADLDQALGAAFASTSNGDVTQKTSE